MSFETVQKKCVQTIVDLAPGNLSVRQDGQALGTQGVINIGHDFVNNILSINNYSLKNRCVTRAKTLVFRILFWYFMSSSAYFFVWGSVCSAQF